MVRTQTAAEIARPVATVFQFVVNEFYTNYPRWSPEVVELEPLDGPKVAAGARARQVRVDHGRRSETYVRVTALSEPDYIEFASEHSPWFRIRFDFLALDSQTTALTFTFELTRLEFYMRPFQGLIRRAIDNGAQRSVAELKRLIESER